MKIVDMNEFLLWSNCPNNCDFCWQKKINNPNCILNDEEMISSISKAKQRIANLPFGDVLLVGGEIFGLKSREVSEAMVDLIVFIRDRIKSNKIRYLYINTNLLYDSLFLIKVLCSEFKGMEESLKFTTSYDLKGRFESKIYMKMLFESNLKTITETYPEINIVVNTILTKDVCNSDFSVKKFCEEYKVKSVNLIPYIPIYYGDPLTPTYGEIISKLLETDREIPGYFEAYVKNFDLDQTKILWEYHKDIDDFVECTAEYLPCGHNKNFTKILKNGECFICRLKEELQG